MSCYIVDASVAVKWFLSEPEAAAALRLLKDDNDLHVPDFFFIEMDNILCKRIRRGEITRDDATAVRRLLHQLPLESHALAEVHPHAYKIAVDTSRSIYDCLYLALAVLLKGRMVTADRRLYESLTDGPFRGYVDWAGNAEEKRS